MVYRHALVCIDLRAVEAQQLLRRAANLIGEGRLSAVSVIEVGTFDEDRDAVAALVEEEYQSRTAHLRRLCSEAERSDAEQRVLVGKAAAEIARFAEEHGCDLVVMGEHEDDGRPPGLGSTADATLRRLGCDALLVKTAAGRA